MSTIDSDETMTNTGQLMQVLRMKQQQYIRSALRNCDLRDDQQDGDFGDEQNSSTGSEFGFANQQQQQQQHQQSPPPTQPQTQQQAQGQQNQSGAYGEEFEEQETALNLCMKSDKSPSPKDSTGLATGVPDGHRLLAQPPTGVTAAATAAAAAAAAAAIVNHQQRHQMDQRNQLLTAATLSHHLQQLQQQAQFEHSLLEHHNHQPNHDHLQQTTEINNNSRLYNQLNHQLSGQTLAAAAAAAAMSNTSGADKSRSLSSSISLSSALSSSSSSSSSSSNSSVTSPPSSVATLSHLFSQQHHNHLNADHMNNNHHHEHHQSHSHPHSSSSSSSPSSSSSSSSTSGVCSGGNSANEGGGSGCADSQASTSCSPDQRHQPQSISMTSSNVLSLGSTLTSALSAAHFLASQNNQILSPDQTNNHQQRQLFFNTHQQHPNQNHNSNSHHHHHHHHHHELGPMHKTDSDDLNRIRSFIEQFKARRGALGLTQKQAAQCFRAYTNDRYAFSDNFVGHFEGFQFRPQTAMTIADSLADWLEFAENETRRGRQLNFMPGKVKETRKRKYEVIRIRDSAKRVLVEAFEKNRSPSTGELEMLSKKTNIPSRNIEIFFKNRRTSRQYHH